MLILKQNYTKMINEFWTKWLLWPKKVISQILQILYYLISTLENDIENELDNIEKLLNEDNNENDTNHKFSTEEDKMLENEIESELESIEKMLNEDEVLENDIENELDNIENLLSEDNDENVTNHEQNKEKDKKLEDEIEHELENIDKILNENGTDDKLSSTEEGKLSGMTSHKKSLITNFGHKHLRQSFIKKLTFFM